MLKLLKNPAQIITVNTNGKNYKRGKEHNEIGVLTGKSLEIEDDKIKNFIDNDKIDESKYDQIIDMENKIILPGLIDCHTHTPFAGSRAGEFKMKLAGTDYEEIAKAGGGINATVQAVRKSSFDELVEIVKPRVDYFISQGITALEMKSGYGLSYYDEIKLLQVVKHLNKIHDIDIIPTFLGAHTFPPEYKNDHEKYLNILSEELLPYVAENQLAKFCDGFCEKTAFSPEQLDVILQKATQLGLKIKLHSEQFNLIGGLDVAIKNNAVSVDHLEVAGDIEVDKISKTETVVVLLPGVSFFLDYGYAPARKLIDGDSIVALSTDYNPGSSHIANLNLIMSLAAIKMNMTIEETISAVTINAAKAVDMQTEIGSLEIGKKADLAIFDTPEYADIVYQVGKNLNVMTIKNGKIIYDAKN